MGNPAIGGRCCFAKIGIRAKCDEPSNWFSAAPLIFDPRPSEAEFSAVFRTLITAGCRLEVAGDVKSGATFDFVADVPAKLGDSRSNSGRIIRLFVQPDSFCALLRSI